MVRTLVTLLTLLRVSKFLVIKVSRSGRYVEKTIAIHFVVFFEEYRTCKYRDCKDFAVKIYLA